jgi:hypothetical protein
MAAGEFAVTTSVSGRAITAAAGATIAAADSNAWAALHAASQTTTQPTTATAYSGTAQTPTAAAAATPTAATAHILTMPEANGEQRDHNRNKAIHFGASNLTHLVCKVMLHHGDVTRLHVLWGTIGAAISESRPFDRFTCAAPTLLPCNAEVGNQYAGLWKQFARKRIPQDLPYHPTLTRLFHKYRNPITQSEVCELERLMPALAQFRIDAGFLLGIFDRCRKVTEGMRISRCASKLLYRPSVLRRRMRRTSLCY